ncbi:MAG: hypothetical protein ACO1NX_00725 [Chitinophagaceae bacterium]
MKQLFTLLCLLLFGHTQAQVVQASFTDKEMTQEIIRLKQMIKEIKDNELQSDKALYQKNYELILNGIEIIKEMHQGSVEIAAARSQNIMYKKLIDVNNPASDVLGFQLLEVITKTLEENINVLPLVDGEKKRLKSQIGNLFEGLKNAFPPLQIITSAVSVISSFTTYQPRIEKLGRKADSLIVDVTNPISKEVLKKINTQLQPYIQFYADLDRINNNYEMALYQHGVEYRDFIEELASLKKVVESRIDMNQSIGNQINRLFDLSNSSMQDFNYRQKMENAVIRDLTADCSGISELVERYKKFTNDFITIQEDFYNNNSLLLKNSAKKLPYKDDAKIDHLLAELDNIKNGNAAQNVTGFDASYKLRLKSITSKLYSINRLRI